MRPRNAFAIARGDRALHIVLTVADKRDMAPDIGPLRTRFQRFIRRFTLPVSTGSGTSRRMYIKMPESIYKSAPQGVQDALAPYIETDHSAHIAAEPWLDDKGSWSPEHHNILDQEFGRELDDDEHPHRWMRP